MSALVRSSRRAGAGVSLCVLAVTASSGGGAAQGGDDTIERVSVGAGGAQADNASANPSLSANARLVAFASDATNLVAGDTNGARDIFVRDRQTGVTELVSGGGQGTPADRGSFLPAISADGRHVAFESDATNLVAGDSNSARDVFVRDRQTGATERVSVRAASVGGNGDSRIPAISADGRYVSFVSGATNLVPGDANSMPDVFVRDRPAGATERVSVGVGGADPNEASIKSAISADGRLVAFASDASNLVPGDANGARDIFVRDRQAGATERVSVDDGENGANGPSADPSISAGGDDVSFASTASNLVGGDRNGDADVFVRSRGAGTTERVSIDSAGAEANGPSAFPSLSTDGRHVAFESQAKNLVPSDTSSRSDIFVRDRVARTTERLSLGGVDKQAKGRSLNAALAADGRFVAFESLARNLVSGDTNGSADVFVRDRPPPVLGTSVSTVPVTDGVLVSLPKGSASSAADTVPGIKGRTFVPLREVRELAVGTLVDARKGTIRLTSAGGKAAGSTQSGSFSAGVFQVLQSRTGSSKGLTTLSLKGASFDSCRGRAAVVGASPPVHAARKKLSKKAIRKLSGNAKGKFRTKGKHSAATVRGTNWTVTDRCDGTLTKVKRGKVTVRDFRRRKNVVVKSGKSYLARAAG